MSGFFHGWFDTGEIPSQLGRTAVVTGATGGLGYETALALAKAGSEVILTGRDDRKGRSAIEKISREVTGAKVSYEHLDLASLTSVADFAPRMHARQPLDLLINNAGVMALPRRQTTADGFEMQFGTNYLGHLAPHGSADAAVAPGKWVQSGGFTPTAGLLARENISEINGAPRLCPHWCPNWLLPLTCRSVATGVGVCGSCTLNLSLAALSSGHDRAPSLRLHRTVPAVEGGAAAVRPALGSRNQA